MFLFLMQHHANLSKKTAYVYAFHLAFDHICSLDKMKWFLGKTIFKKLPNKRKTVAVLIGEPLVLKSNHHQPLELFYKNHYNNVAITQRRS